MVDQILVEKVVVHELVILMEFALFYENYIKRSHFSWNKTLYCQA